MAIVVDVKNKLIDFIPEAEDEGCITLSLREFWDLVLEIKEMLKKGKGGRVCGLKRKKEI